MVASLAPLAAMPQAMREKKFKTARRKRYHGQSSVKISDFMAELRKKHNGSGAPVLVTKSKKLKDLTDDLTDDSSSSNEIASETEKDSDDEMYLDNSEAPAWRRTMKEYRSCEDGQESGENREENSPAKSGDDSEDDGEDDGEGDGEDDGETTDDSKTNSGRRHRRKLKHPSYVKSRDDVATIVEAVIRVMDGRNSRTPSDAKSRKQRQRRGPKANISAEVQRIKKKEPSEDRNVFLVSTTLSFDQDSNSHKQRS